jgi:hypothetical protein
MYKEFVTYEQALELKALGFDEPCFAYYGLNNVEDKLFFDIDPDDGELTSLNQNQFYHNNLSEVGRISAPLKQQVFRWFRAKHQLFHGIDNNCSQLTSEWGFDYTTFDRNNDKWTSTEPQNGPVGETTYKTYEEAESDCLNKLIKIVNNF